MKTSQPLRNAVWVLVASTGLLVLMAAPHPDVAKAIAAIGQSFEWPAVRRPSKLSSFREPLPSSGQVKSVISEPVVGRVAGVGAEFSERSPQNIPKFNAATIRRPTQHRLKSGRVAARHVSRPEPTIHGRPTTRHRRSTVFVVSATPPPKGTGPRVELGTIEEVDDHPRFDDNHPSPTPDALPKTAKVEARLAALQRTIDRLAQTQTDQQTQDLERATQQLEQMQQSGRLRELERRIQQLQSNDSAVTTSPLVDAAASGSSAAAAKTKTTVVKAGPDNAGAERFSLQIHDAEISEVLEMLGQMAGLNILIGRDVAGTIPSANLKNVTIEQALDGIVRSLGLAYDRDDNFIFVMTEAEHETRRQLSRQLISKVYRPDYISVLDLQTLIAPLLTESVGKVAVTNPSETGLATDAENAGGDALAQQDAILVMDYAEVIQEVDALIEEMDVPPLQVVIEAMLLSVQLNDEMKFGVNFALLNGNSNHLLVSGNGQTLNRSSGFPGAPDERIVPPVGDFLANAAGLKFGFIRGDISAFVDALENIADTNLIASPQLRVLNKQKAHLIIGDRLSYVTSTLNDNTTIQNVNFLDVGTKLVIRPFISADGLIRMEVHPERSTARINPQTGLPDLRTTEVTTNVMVRDGMTVVIGGLIEEQVQESIDQIPFLGSLPLIGPVFRNKSESIVRSELIILITPRIVRDPVESIDGEAARFENERRAEHFRNNLSPINRNNLARMEYERARYYLSRDRFLKARDHVKRSLKHNKNDLEALRLQDQIEQAIGETKRRWFGLPVPRVFPSTRDTLQKTMEPEPVPESRLPPVLDNEYIAP